MKNETQMRIEKEILKDLKKLKLVEGESYNNVIKRMLKETMEKNRK